MGHPDFESFLNRHLAYSTKFAVTSNCQRARATNPTLTKDYFKKFGEVQKDHVFKLENMYLGARVSRLAVTLTFDLWQPLVQYDEREFLLDYNNRMPLCGTGDVCTVFYYYPHTCGSEGHGSEQWFLLDFISLLTQSGTETPRVSSRPSMVLPSPRFFPQGKDEGND